MSKYTIINSDALTALRTLEAGSIQLVVTSPPYFGLRDYEEKGQLGLEKSLDCAGWAKESGDRCDTCYICRLRSVFSEVKRTLKNDGICFLNIGDTYKNKNLCLVPQRLALGLQKDNWIIRQDIIWSKPCPMPEPALDRCVRAHEYLWMLTKDQTYYFNAEAIKEQASGLRTGGFSKRTDAARKGVVSGGKPSDLSGKSWETKNRRSVWTLNNGGEGSGLHFATMPEDMASLCVLAGSLPGQRVLDPFMGSGTTGIAALRHGRVFTGIELSAKFCHLSLGRLNASSHQEVMDL